MLSIQYLGHSCFKISNGITSIVFDPYQDNSVPSLRLPRIKATYVLSSHNHADHNALNLVNDEEEVFEALDKTIIPSYHDHHQGEHRGLNDIHIVNIGGYRICHLGDLGEIPNQETILKLQNIDVMFVPINGHYTISSLEAKKLYELTKPKLLIPMHYYFDTFSSGYPDGGQIHKFKSLFPKVIEVNNDTVEITAELLQENVLIFNKYKVEDDV